MSDDVKLTASFPDPTQLSVTCGESLGMRLELTHPHANCLVFDLSKHVIVSAWNIRLCSLSSLVPPTPTLLLPGRRVGTRLRTVISHLYDLTFCTTYLQWRYIELCMICCLGHRAITDCSAGCVQDVLPPPCQHGTTKEKEGIKCIVTDWLVGRWSSECVDGWVGEQVHTHRCVSGISYVQCTTQSQACSADSWYEVWSLLILVCRCGFGHLKKP